MRLSGLDIHNKDYSLIEYMAVGRKHSHLETNPWQKYLNFKIQDWDTTKGFSCKNFQIKTVSSVLSKQWPTWKRKRSHEVYNARRRTEASFRNRPHHTDRNVVTMRKRTLRLKWRRNKQRRGKGKSYRASFSVPVVQFRKQVNLGLYKTEAIHPSVNSLSFLSPSLALPELL